MHSAIIYAVMPDNDNDWREEAFRLRSSVAKAAEHKSVRQLGDFVWEVNFREAPDALGLILYALSQRKLPYAILPIDGEPQWIQHQPSLK